MSRGLKWLLGTLLVLLLLLAGTLLALNRWLDTEDFRMRAQTEASTALGAPIQIGRLGVSLWPLPALTLEDLRTQAQPVLSVGRVELRPEWGGLLRSEPQVALLVLRQARVPEAALNALAAALQAGKQGASGTRGVPQQSSGQGPPLPTWLPQRIRWQDFTWVSAGGAESTLNGETRLGLDGLPEMVDTRVIAGAWKDSSIRLERWVHAKEAAQAAGWPSWKVDAGIAGGTVKGHISARLPGFGPRPKQIASEEMWAIKAQLETQGVEVARLLAPPASLSGRLQASSALQAQAKEPAALIDVLQSQTSFTVNKAVLHGLDLARAVKTVGLNRGGQTALDRLSGKLLTQGRVVQVNQLQASSGLLSVNGSVGISTSRSLSGRINVDMEPGIVGVPLLLGGTLESPSVTLPKGALVGAAIGTALLPGVGTGAGAKFGEKLGEGLKGLFRQGK